MTRILLIRTTDFTLDKSGKVGLATLARIH